MKQYYALSRLSGNFRGETCIDRICGSKSMWMDPEVEFVSRVEIYPETLAVITKNSRDYAVVDSGQGNFVQATAVICHGGIKLNIAAFGFTPEKAVVRLRKFIISEIKHINSTIS